MPYDIYAFSVPTGKVGARSVLRDALCKRVVRDFLISKVVFPKSTGRLKYRLRVR